MEYKVPSQCNSTWVNKISMEHKYCWYSKQQSYFLSVPRPSVLACPVHWPAAPDYLAASPNLNYLLKNIVSPLHHYFCTHSLSSPTAPLPLLRSLPWNDCQFLLLPHQSDLNESPHSHNPSSMLLYASTWHSSTFTHQVAAKALVLVFTDILPSDLS